MDPSTNHQNQPPLVHKPFSFTALIAKEGELIDSPEGPMLLSSEAFDEVVAHQRREVGNALPVQKQTSGGVFIVRGPVLREVRVEGEPGEREAFIVAEVDADTDPSFVDMMAASAAIDETSVGFVVEGVEEEGDDG